MKNKGFTLIELVLALSLASIIMLSALQFLSVNLNLYRRSSQKAADLQVSNLILSRLSSEIRSSERILDLREGSLTLSLEGQSILYDLKDGKLRRKTEKSTAYLTDKGDLEGLSFKELSAGLIELKLRAGGKEYGTQAYCRNQ